MKKFTVALSCVVLAALVFATPEPDNDKPQYTRSGELVRPEHYREWVFLSSGFGMNYSPAPGSHDMFSNVFVPGWAYREFVQSGHWPDKTVFVVEERMAQSKGSINKHGNFQTDLMGLGVEVKDSALPDKWAYYSFQSNRTAAANPKPGCFSCHEQHAAVEHTFVQFYPTLKPIAKEFGTYRQSAEKVE
ncbi:MAG TPA: cytochrome P460 family protein [Terriglobales bacterium]